MYDDYVKDLALVQKKIDKILEEGFGEVLIKIQDSEIVFVEATEKTKL